MKHVCLTDLLSIINSNLRETIITPEKITQNLSEFGMDSITFIQIIIAIEKEFECEIPDSKLLITEMDTVEKIINVLQTLYDESNAKSEICHNIEHIL